MFEPFFEEAVEEQDVGHLPYPHRVERAFESYLLEGHNLISCWLVIEFGQVIQ